MLREPLGLREIAAQVFTLGGVTVALRAQFRKRKDGAGECAALRTQDIALLDRAGMPLSVIAKIGS